MYADYVAARLSITSADCTSAEAIQAIDTLRRWVQDSTFVLYAVDAQAHAHAKELHESLPKLTKLP